MTIILTALIVVFVLEKYLLHRWSTSLFTRGTPIFTARIPANATSRALLYPDRLEQDVAPLTTITLAFHALAKDRIAFREGSVIGFANVQQRYYPVMRGLIEVDAGRNEIRVQGLCNWTVLVFPLVFLVLAIVGTDKTTAIAPLLGFLAVFGIGYYIQRKAYRSVVEVIRTQTAGP